jgi:hypothetical protein
MSAFEKVALIMFFIYVISIEVSVCVANIR